jgi:Glycosyl hydrolases family 43
MRHEQVLGQTSANASRHIGRRKLLQGAAIAGIGTLAGTSWLAHSSLTSAAGYNYVFSNFHSDGASGEKLSIFTSGDGLNFSLLSNTGYGGSTGILRDPSITRQPDGTYYITYTPRSWTTSNNNFGIASSTDLVHWSLVTNVTSTVANTTYVWAPEWFKDTDGSVNILVAIDDSGKRSNFRIFKFTATNSSLTSWSKPTLIIGSGNYIDPFMVKLGNTYHLFAKGPTYIETATATHLTGPWTWRTGNWAGWGNDKEGPAAFQLENGNWRVALDYDLGGHKQYVYSDSTDGLKTWTAPKPFPGLSGVVRHGTILKIH